MVRENEVAFDVITTMWNRNATMAIVVSQDGGTERVLGVVTKEHVADTVARSVQIYPGRGGTRGENAMGIRPPELRWPSELAEEGPPEDPTILLRGAAEIGAAPHRVVAVRLNPARWRWITGRMWRRRSMRTMNWRPCSRS